MIVSLVFGLLLESVTSNLSDIGRARLEARATQLAEERGREMVDELGLGSTVELGVTEGEYEDPDADLRWQVAVTEHTLDLPEDYPTDKEPPSPLFARPGAPRAPNPAATPDQPPPLRLVEIRVFPAEADPNSVDPFVLLLTAPPDPARLQQLQQTRQQTPTQIDGAMAGHPP